MKRPLLIILGIIIVLILIGIWAYVLLTGSTTNSDPFADFGFGDSTDTTIQEPSISDERPVVDVSTAEALRQLTTDPVAGFAEVQVDASSTPQVQYVEAGTGHIFTIDFSTGEERRVSATTIPLTTKAAITPNGAHVLMQAGAGRSTEYIIGTLSTTSTELSNFALSEPALSFAATSDNELVYLTPNGNETLAKAYTPANNSTRVLFTIPFREVAIDWASNAAGPHLVYPKAASRLEGFVYSYTNGVMTRLPISGYGLSAVGSETDVIRSNVLSTGEYISSGYSYDGEFFGSVPITVIPDKCAFSPIIPSTAICGANLSDYPSTIPDTWYKGEFTTADELWEIDRNSAGLINNMSDNTQRAIDVINPMFSPTGERYYFQNKIDQTLWVYDFTI